MTIVTGTARPVSQFGDGTRALRLRALTDCVSADLREHYARTGADAAVLQIRGDTHLGSFAARTDACIRMRARLPRAGAPGCAVRFVHLARQLWLGATSRSASHYWERRYKAGMTSGPGSFGELADFKARTVNEHVRQHDVRSVIELGCGDGRQLALAEYPTYLGLDVSKTAIDLCIERFGRDATKSFLWYDPARSVNLSTFLSADLVLSLDVIYHLLEDGTYRRYLQDLFSMARRFVIIYSSDRDPGRTAAHVRHRRFTEDVRRDYPAFRLIERIPNPRPHESFADFYVYQRGA